MMERAKSEDYERINDYFNETGWSVDSNTTVLKTDSIEEVVKFLGHDIVGLNYEQLEELTDVRNVWFDGEETCNYYVIVEEEF